jgi:hypothetical protein
LTTRSIKQPLSLSGNLESGSGYLIGLKHPNGRSQARLFEPGVTVIDPTSGPEWDRLACSHPDSSFFHSSAWARVLTRTYGHKPSYFHFSEKGNSLAFVPIMEVDSPFTGRRGVCLPFSDSCQPLIFPGANAASLLRTVRILAQQRRWRHVEFRGGTQFGHSNSGPAAFHGHTLDLRPGAETIFSLFDSSVRRAIRKGERSGLTIHIEHGWEAMQEFCLLHAWTRRRHGVPPQPAVFFRQIHEQVIKPGLGFVVLARQNATTIAAAVFFVWGAKAIYKFGASDQTARDLRGNNLMMWEAIRFLAGNGAQQLDFGRTAAADKGLRRFKLGWGTSESDINYSRFDTETRKWMPLRRTNSSLSSHFFRRMPLAVNQIAGRLIYPHLD